MFKLGIVTFTFAIWNFYITFASPIHRKHGEEVGNLVQLRYTIEVTHGVTVSSDGTPLLHLATNDHEAPTIDVSASSKIPANVVKILIIGVLLVFALVLSRPLVQYSRKRIAQRRVRMFQSRSSNTQGRTSTETAGIVTETSVFEDGSVQTSISESASRKQANNLQEEDNVCDAREIATNTPPELRIIKPSLKRNKFPPGIDIGIPYNETGEMKQKPKPRPVSVDFGLGLSFMRKPGAKFPRRNDKKRHSSHVVMESLTQSESSSQSRITIIENLAYEDLIQSRPVLNNLNEKCEYDKISDAISKSLVPVNYGLGGKCEPRSVIRKKQVHQYETITCDDTSSGITPKKLTLRPPSPIQIKRESKSEDLTIFPTRYARQSNQYEPMRIKETQNQTIPPTSCHSHPVHPDKQIIVGCNDIGSKEVDDNEEKGKFWPPPITKIKRSRIFVCKNTDKLAAAHPIEETSNEKASGNIQREVEYSKKMKEDISDTFSRARSRSEPKQLKRMRHFVGIRAKPSALFRADGYVVTDGGTKKKIRKQKPKRKSPGKNKVAKTNNESNVAGQAEQKMKPAATKVRRRTKRKVCKKRRSRDEIKRQLQLRLLGYDIASTGDGLGTTESYRIENNERASGFVAGTRWKLGSEPLGFYSTDTSEDGGQTTSGRRRIHSHEDWCQKWSEKRAKESTLLEEIWRHLNIIAERSRLLKDSSSSRRRSQSLTSSETSTNRVRLRNHYVTVEESEEDSSTNAPSDQADEDLPIMYESTSDNGYCTYSHLPTRLQPHLAIPFNLVEGGVVLEADTPPRGLGESRNVLPESEICHKDGTTNPLEPPAISIAMKRELTQGEAGAGPIHVYANIPSDVSAEDNRAKYTLCDVIPIYGKLADYYSFSSSVSSSCSSLAMTNQIPTSIVSRIPQILQKKISQESQILEVAMAENTKKTGKCGSELSEEGVVVALEKTRESAIISPNDTKLGFVDSKREKCGENRCPEPLNVARNICSKVNTSDTLLEAGVKGTAKIRASSLSIDRVHRLKRRTGSEGNYIVVPPNSLLRKNRSHVTVKEEKVGIKEKRDLRMDEDDALLKANTRIPLIEKTIVVEAPMTDSDATIISDDVHSKSGSDNVFNDAGYHKPEDSDESLFQVFMEMAV